MTRTPRLIHSTEATGSSNMGRGEASAGLVIRREVVRLNRPGAHTFYGEREAGNPGAPPEDAA